MFYILIILLKLDVLEISSLFTVTVEKFLKIMSMYGTLQWRLLEKLYCHGDLTSKSSLKEKKLTYVGFL